MKPIFESCKEELEKIAKKINTKGSKDTCMNCGNVVEWSEKQWKQSCTCGVVHTRSPKLITVKTKEPKCWICMDTGIVEYLLQKEGVIGNYVSRCTCVEANNYPGLMRYTDSLCAPSKEYIYGRNRKKFNELETKI